MRKLLYLIWIGAVALAQTPPPVLDGKLDDPFWKQVKWVRLSPVEQGVPEAGGEVRMLVSGRYVYIAARLPEPSGRVTARMTGLNPNWEDEDLLRVTVGPDIGYTDRVIKVNPFGARSIEREGQPIFLNADRYLVATAVGEKEWTVEMAVPLNEVSAPGSEPVLATVERYRAMRPGAPQQRWRWPVHEPATKLAVDDKSNWSAAPPLLRAATSGNREAPLEAGRVRALPPIDATWDDPAWNAPAVRLLRDEEPARPARLATEIKLLHDGSTLAVMARCAEPSSVLAQPRERDAAQDGDDAFHLYLTTSGSAYAQIAVNAMGSLLDVAGKTGGPRISRPRADWDSGTETLSRRENGYWTVRLNVPLEHAANILGETRIPSEFRMLAARLRPGRNGDPTETSVLPVVQSETLLCPARYRRLRLLAGPAKAAAAPGVSGLAAFDAQVFSAEKRKEMNLPAMVERHARMRAVKMLEAERDAWNQVRTVADWERFRDPRIAALKRYVGDLPTRPPLRTTVTKEYAGEGYRRQNLIYQSRPGFWVTANLYLPAKPAAGMPGIALIHSHHRPKWQAELQDMGILWARAGCAVIVLDQIPHGERIAAYPWNRDAYHYREIASMQLELAGESLVKWMAWDTLRAFDLLLERKDVDPAKLILLGAVAGGGDPAALAAALDPRIAAVVPFNFGEATPRSGGRGRWPLGLADPGWGSWDTVRNLPGSISGQFLPWLICASVAPRRFVYSYEMGWDVEQQPAWARYKKVFELYNARDNLDEAHGFGAFPGPGECSNIGPSQRKTLYPELLRWFGIPIPESEPNDRRPEAELAALTPRAAATLEMRELHQIALEIARPKLEAVRAEMVKMPAAERIARMRREWAALLGDIAPNPRPRAEPVWNRPAADGQAEGISLEVEPGIVVPVVLLKPASGAAPFPVVLAVAQGGKEALLAHRAAEIEALLKAGAAVCLPDVRGTGETAPDSRRSQSSASISWSASELMLGNTALGARLKDLRTVLAYVASRSDLDAARISLWGESVAPPNPSRLLLDESPGWRLGPEIQQQAEPLGGLLALLGSLYEDRVRAVVVRRPLTGYLSILEDRFAYVPADAMIPGILRHGDIDDVAANLPARRVVLESPVDGRNRVLPQPVARARFASLSERYGVGREHIVVRPAGVPAALAKALLE